MLAERVKLVVGKLVGAVQNAFIKGRCILDGVLIANETVGYIKKNKKKCLMFKVDFEKVYVCFNWKYMTGMMRFMGFRGKWCRWIEECMKSASVSVLVNGSPIKKFQIEGLNAMVNEAVTKRIFNGVQIGTSDVTISHLHNLHKSRVYGLGVEQCAVERMAKWMGSSVGELPLTYLGLPIGESGRWCKESVVADKGRWVEGTWRWVWDWVREPRGRVVGYDIFSVKALSDLVEVKCINAGNHNSETTWNNLVPKKVNIFAWRAVRGRLPVRIELDKKGIDLHTILCPNCDEMCETIDHSLVFCNEAMKMHKRDTVELLLPYVSNQCLWSLVLGRSVSDVQ
ncbi:RNA-directed DNA polymerase, eukaryota, reverse transcriptase zinc-binding domain protein [Tanacetum coccineum]